MATKQVEKLPLPVLKKVKGLVVKDRIKKIHDETIRLTKTLKRVPKLLDKKELDTVMESDDVEGKRALVKDARLAVKNLKIELDTIKRTMKMLEESHKFLGKHAKNVHTLQQHLERALKNPK